MTRLYFLLGTTTRLLLAVVAIVAMVALVASDAHARAGGGFSGGSRGMRTFSAPPATRTAPNAAAPMQRTLTQPGGAGAVGQTASRPGLFGGGLLGGLAGGFLGAGLFGLLFGHGFFGGMGGFASLFGLMLQIGADRDRGAAAVCVVATPQRAGGSLCRRPSGDRSFL